MELLVRTKESSKRIAETVGYVTGFALLKAFKRIAGCRPSNIGDKQPDDLLAIRRGAHSCLQQAG